MLAQIQTSLSLLPNIAIVSPYSIISIVLIEKVYIVFDL